MEEFPIETIDVLKYFPQLSEIPQPPKKLYIRGDLERVLGTTFITVVGSRSYSAYGKMVCEKLISDLASYPITKVSGLALGIDSTAHLPTIILNETEEKIISILRTPLSRDTIIEQLALDPSTDAIALSTLEIRGVIKETYRLIERIIC